MNSLKTICWHPTCQYRRSTPVSEAENAKAVCSRRRLHCCIKSYKFRVIPSMQILLTKTVKNVYITSLIFPHTFPEANNGYGAASTPPVVQPDLKATIFCCLSLLPYFLSTSSSPTFSVTGNWAIPWGKKGLGFEIGAADKKGQQSVFTSRKQQEKGFICDFSHPWRATATVIVLSRSPAILLLSFILENCAF